MQEETKRIKMEITEEKLKSLINRMVTDEARKEGERILPPLFKATNKVLIGAGMPILSDREECIAAMIITTMLKQTIPLTIDEKEIESMLRAEMIKESAH
jgi:hypothetical protein